MFEFVLVKEILDLVLFPREKCEFENSLPKNIEFKKRGVCVGEDDVYFNHTIVKYHLMNGYIPWRGTHEKHPTLIHMFIEVLCKLGGVVVDVTSSTCGFVILSVAFMFQ